MVSLLIIQLAFNAEILDTIRVNYNLQISEKNLIYLEM